jgi:hypothetical protein
MAGAGVQYNSPTTALTEGSTIQVVSAGYDGTGNYIADVQADWSTSGSGVSFATSPTGAASVQLDGLVAGLNDVTATVAPQAGDEFSTVTRTVTFNVQPAPARSYTVRLVQADGVSPQYLDGDNDGQVNDVAVRAGEAFNLRVEAHTAVGGGGVIATSYTGLKKLLFNAVAQNSPIFRR